MAHLEKFTKAACGHLFKHYERAKEFDPDTGLLEYVQFSNQQIDLSRTHLNYNLAVNQTMRQGEFIRKRCSEVKLHNRANVKVMCSWVITAPKELPKEELQAFFKACYEFMAKRYGEENVISAYVHMDETTPHMHFAFVPVTPDKKKGGYKVSAKEVIDKQELLVFHKELSKHLEKALGHSVGVLNGATAQGNKTIAELKEKSAMERAERAEKQARKSEEDLRSIKAQVETASEGLKDILDKKARAAEIKSLHLFGETVKYDKAMLESTRAIGTEAAEKLRQAIDKEQANAAREQRLKEWSLEIVPLHEQAENSAIAAQTEYDRAKELREKQESFIRGTARKIAEKMTEQRITEMFGDIPDTRGKRLEDFCERLKFADGTNALQAFEKQEQALKARSRGHGR